LYRTQSYDAIKTFARYDFHIVNLNYRYNIILYIIYYTGYYIIYYTGIISSRVQNFRRIRYTKQQKKLIN